MTVFLTEVKKTKNRYIWLMFPAILLFDYGWMAWMMRKAKETELLQGYYRLLMTFPLINTIIMPLTIAVIASRICDVENKGNTYKLLCTLENKSTIFRNKFLLGGIYLLGFTVLQILLILFLGWNCRITQAIPWEHVIYFGISTFVTGLVIYLLQQILSLMMDNQLYPLFIGLIGTFVGLFSWFFPNLPLRNLIPWGYYCVGTTINMIWFEEERVVEYFTVPFSYGWFIVHTLFAVLLYQYGQNLLNKKEV